MLEIVDNLFDTNLKFRMIGFMGLVLIRTSTALNQERT